MASVPGTSSPSAIPPATPSSAAASATSSATYATTSTGRETTASAWPARTVASNVPRCSRARSRARSIAARAPPAAGPETAELDGVVAEAHADRDVRRVLQRVEQLLHDPVRGQLHRRGQRARAALDGQPRVRALRAGEQRLQVGERRLWRRRGERRVGAEHADGLAHLLERGPALALDRGEQRGRLGRIVRARPRVREPADRADLPVQHVAELAAQPRAVGGDLEPGALVARAPQLDRPGAQLVGREPARMDEPADAPHRRRDGREHRGGGDVELDHEVEDRERAGDQQAEQRAAAVQPRARRVGEQERGGQQDAAADVLAADERQVDHEAGERRAGGGERGDAPPQERDRDEEEERHRGPVRQQVADVDRGLLVRAPRPFREVPDVLDHQEHPERAHEERDRDVQPADPRLRGGHHVHPLHSWSTTPGCALRFPPSSPAGMNRAPAGHPAG